MGTSDGPGLMLSYGSAGRELSGWAVTSTGGLRQKELFPGDGAMMDSGSGIKHKKYLSQSKFVSFSKKMQARKSSLKLFHRSKGVNYL